MHWIGPSENYSGGAMLEIRLWDSAYQFRANSGLKAQQYTGPILGIIFLRFAEVRFAAQRADLKLLSTSGRGAGDEGKQNRADMLLFDDARHIYRQADRARHDWTSAQTAFLIPLYRGEALDLILGGDEAKARVQELFPSPRKRGEGQGEGCVYQDIPGSRKAATNQQIAAQVWSHLRRL